MLERERKKFSSSLRWMGAVTTRFKLFIFILHLSALNFERREWVRELWKKYFEVAGKYEARKNLILMPWRCLLMIKYNNFLIVSIHIIKDICDDKKVFKLPQKRISSSFVKLYRLHIFFFLLFYFSKSFTSLLRMKTNKSHLNSVNEPNRKFSLNFKFN